MAKMCDSEPSIANLLIATLLSARSTRRFRSILRERQLERYKAGSVSVALNRLRKKKYVKYDSLGWSLTSLGKISAARKHLLQYIPSPFAKNAPDMTVISFDIPEPDRALRYWLRNQIKIFGYKMLQQSLWLGPGPLPKNFLKRLEDLKIRSKIKIFSRVKKLS